MLDALSILGGLTLILFGARFLNKGLDRLVGKRLGHWLDRLAGRPRNAFATGVALSIVAPSSTTMSVLAAQGVRTGLLDAQRMLALLLGASLGMTVAVQLIALNVQMLAPSLLAVGGILFMYTRAPTTRGAGQLLLALGFIFMAMQLISGGAGAVAESQDLQDLLVIARRHPLLLATIGAILTALLQSSKATVGLLIGLAAGGAVDLHAAGSFVIGVNVGLAVTTIAVTWSDNGARRMGVALMGLKVLVALPCLLLIGPAVDLAERIPVPDGTRIATLHSAYNVVLAIVALPLTGVAMSIVSRVVPDPVSSDSSEFMPRHIRGIPPERPALAMNESMREILHVSEIVRSMLDDAWDALKSRNTELAQDVGARDDRVDMLDIEIKRFLVKVGAGGLDDGEAAEQMLQLRYLNDLETVGDIIDKNLTQLIVKKLAATSEFSDDGMLELDTFFNAVRESLLLADAIFLKREQSLARRLLRHKERVNAEEVQLRDQHLARLIGGRADSQGTTGVHLDLLAHLKRINSAASGIAYELLRTANQPASKQTP